MSETIGGILWGPQHPKTEQALADLTKRVEALEKRAECGARQAPAGARCTMDKGHPRPHFTVADGEMLAWDGCHCQPFGCNCEHATPDPAPVPECEALDPRGIRVCHKAAGHTPPHRGHPHEMGSWNDPAPVHGCAYGCDDPAPTPEPSLREEIAIWLYPHEWDAAEEYQREIYRNSADWLIDKVRDADLTDEVTS